MSHANTQACHMQTPRHVTCRHPGMSHANTQARNLSPIQLKEHELTQRTYTMMQNSGTQQRPCKPTGLRMVKARTCSLKKCAKVRTISKSGGETETRGTEHAHSTTSWPVPKISQQCCTPSAYPSALSRASRRIAWSEPTITKVSKLTCTHRVAMRATALATPVSAYHLVGILITLTQTPLA